MPRSRWPLVALLAAAGCTGRAPEAALGAPTIDTLPDGVIRVTNQRPTAWTDTNGWRLVAERVIQPAEGSPGEFSDVTKLVADDDGNVYVMQIMPTTIKAFDASGNFLRTIGREGNGPGEFPDGMLALHRDTLLIQDPNNQRLTTYLTDGTLVGMARSQCCYFTSALPRLDDGSVLIMGPPPEGSVGVRLAYYRTRSDGTVIDTIRQPIPAASDTPVWRAVRQTPNGQADVTIGVPGQPQNHSVWRGDGTMVVGNTGEYRLAIRRGFADTLRVIRAEAPQLVRTDAEREAMLERAIATQGPLWGEALRAVARVDQIPVDRPRWSSVAVDRANRIWVGLPGEGTDVAVLDVFSSDGVLLGRVPAPHPAILDGYWTRDRVFVRDTDDLGRPLVRVYRLQTTVP